MEGFLKWLQGLNIKNSPRNMQELLQMQELDLSYQGLSSLPDEICNLTNLKGLNLIRNELRCLPDNFNKLTNLTKLALCSNRYLRDICAISELQNLQWLNLGNNQDIEIPNLSKLQNLKTLYLQYMEIGNYSIDTIIQAKNIETLNIAQNRFDDIEALGNLKNLKCIVFDADSWHLQVPATPRWLDNNWETKKELFNDWFFVYVCEKRK